MTIVRAAVHVAVQVAVSPLVPASIELGMATRGVSDSAVRSCGRGRARRVARKTGSRNVPPAKQEAQHDDEGEETDEHGPDVAPLLACNWNFSHDIPHC